MKPCCTGDYSSFIRVSPLLKLLRAEVEKLKDELKNIKELMMQPKFKSRDTGLFIISASPAWGRLGN